jgi:hypothetical protein
VERYTAKTKVERVPPVPTCHTLMTSMGNDAGETGGTIPRHGNLSADLDF